jgi:hypothetical protein
LVALALFRRPRSRAWLVIVNVPRVSRAARCTLGFMLPPAFAG